YLNGLTLDYSEDLMGGGFRFNNPNAKVVCGCGNSFSV
ncbi:iron-sulfur cluster assembly accessory protein, partial [Hydrocoleum sp. CS-953]